MQDNGIWYSDTSIRGNIAITTSHHHKHCYSSTPPNHWSLQDHNTLLMVIPSVLLTVSLGLTLEGGIYITPLSFVLCIDCGFSVRGKISKPIATVLNSIGYPSLSEGKTLADHSDNYTTISLSRELLEPVRDSKIVFQFLALSLYVCVCTVL